MRGKTVVFFYLYEILFLMEGGKIDKNKDCLPDMNVFLDGVLEELCPILFEP